MLGIFSETLDNKNAIIPGGKKCTWEREQCNHI